MRMTRTFVWSALALVLAVPAVFADEAAEAQPPEEPQTLLRLDVVMTRSKGDAVVARLPYSMLLNTGGDVARVYGGIQLPIVVQHQGSNTVMFKNAGGNVSARAWALDDHRFKLALSTELGGVYPANGDTASEATEGPPAAPVLRSFSTEATVTLGDGESTRLSDSADPITGETVRTEVTLHVAE
jgi:Flp pilus assembly secretin CpaC